MDDFQYLNGKLHVEEVSLENNGQKHEKIIIPVKMNKDEENVYSLMGLDPVLLLDEPPLSDNYTVQIIRPGEDKDKILDEARKNIINNSNKFRFRSLINSSRLLNLYTSNSLSLYIYLIS